MLWWSNILWGTRHGPFFLFTGLPTMSWCSKFTIIWWLIKFLKHDVLPVPCLFFFWNWNLRVSYLFNASFGPATLFYFILSASIDQSPSIRNRWIESNLLLVRKWIPVYIFLAFCRYIVVLSFCSDQDMLNFWNKIAACINQLIFTFLVPSELDSYGPLWSDLVLQ